MRVRNGFVSNSSSSSFVISKSLLDADQIKMIKNHIAIAQKLEIFSGESKKWWSTGDEWEITEHDKNITGYTSMDNFNMGKFLTMVVGLDIENIRWGR